MFLYIWKERYTYIHSTDSKQSTKKKDDTQNICESDTNEKYTREIEKKRKYEKCIKTAKHKKM